MTKKTNQKKPQTIEAVFVLTDSGKYKITTAITSDSKGGYVRANSRNTARLLNKSELVIK